MSLTVTEAVAVSTLLRYLLHQPDSGKVPVADSVRDAAGLLADKARKTLLTGPGHEEVAAMWEAAPPVLVRAPAFVADFAPDRVRAWFAAEECPECDSRIPHKYCDRAAVARLSDEQLSVAAYRLLDREYGLAEAERDAMTDLVRLAIEEKARAGEAGLEGEQRSSAPGGHRPEAGVPGVGVSSPLVEVAQTEEVV